VSDISILFSRNSDEWGTPPDICKDLGEAHNIKVDVACNTVNAKYPVALARDAGIDGLCVPWHEIKAVKEGYACFCNPPHSTLSKWVEKAIMEARADVRTVMLIPASTGTDHWHNLVLPNAVEIQEVKHRISFFGKVKLPKQPKDLPKEQIQYKMDYAPATFDSAILIFDNSRPRTPQGRPWRTEYIQPKDRKKEE
jgi:hypothetical protein